VLNEDEIRVRFAPSPTGYLHIGGARTALFNWLFARKNNGVFVLRIEDTDEARSTEEMVASITDSLEWLGLNWDEGPGVGGDYGPYCQSERKGIYAEHAEKLIEEGKAYHCYCTAEELEERKSASLAVGQAPKYDGRCRELSSAQKSIYEKEGRAASVRFRVPEREKVVVQDLVHGQKELEGAGIGDFVIMRSDGSASFHLANVVDDTLMKISHSIRGEDLLASAFRQLLLYEAFGYKKPQYAHLPMILAPDRSKLSKRHGAISVTAYRDMGYLPEAMLNYLALLGWSPPDEKEIMSIDELKEKFSIERISKSNAIFDVAKFTYINGIKIRELEAAELRKRIEPYIEQDLELSSDKMDKAVLLLQDSIERLSEFREKAKIFTKLPDYSDDVINAAKKSPNARDVLEAFARAIKRQDDLSKEGIVGMFRELSKETGQRGKVLYTPVRLALTGEEHGPELVGVIEILGKEESRLRALRLAQRI
jgi:nondiscriminating glutamyl-tRNA synthetase